MASRSNYRLAILDPGSGDTLRVVERVHEPVPVTDQLWAIETREFHERDRTEGPFACGIESRRPELLPVIRSVVSDDSGRVWVESMTGREAFLIAAVDSAGRVLGEATLPPRDDGVPLYIRDGKLYLVAQDSLGVQAVHTYRIDLAQRM